MRINAQSGAGVVSLSAVEALLEVLEATGGNIEEALSSAGLLDLRPMLWRGGEAEITWERFSRLSGHCVVIFHNRACARDGVRPLPTSYFTFLAHSILSCPCLRTAIAVASGFQEMMLANRGHLRLTLSEGMATLMLDLGNRDRDVPNLLVTMYALAYFYRLFGWLIREDIPLADMSLDFPAGVEQTAFNALIGFRPKFGQPRNAITFPESYLNYTVKRTYRELPEILKILPFDMTRSQDGAPSLNDKVQRAIHAALDFNSPIPTMPALARIFTLTVPTFRRRLAAEGVSLRTIRKSCQIGFASRLLAETNISVTEIALRSQYHDAASFRRAFNASMGMAPEKYRKSVR